MGTASDVLEKRLEALGCRLASRWQLLCTTFFRQTPAKAPVDMLFMLHSTDQPKVCYLLSQGVLVLAGPEIPSVIDETEAYVKKIRVVVDGALHECGDFTVRVGKLHLNQQHQGSVLDVEYKPCTLATAHVEPLRQFVGLLIPETLSESCRDFISKPSCFELASDLPTHFSLQHSVCQFVSLIRTRILASG
ncbi:MAG: hypothetical protein SGPRY_014927 [Prymnesium sp.]